MGTNLQIFFQTTIIFSIKKDYDVNICNLFSTKFQNFFFTFIDLTTQSQYSSYKNNNKDKLKPLLSTKPR